MSLATFNLGSFLYSACGFKQQSYQIWVWVKAADINAFVE